MKHLTNLISFLFILIFILSCSKNDNETGPNRPFDDDIEIEQPDTNTSEQTNLYFPPTNSDTWETTQLSDLNWNEANLDALYTYLENNDTRAFIILKDGKIVVENYFGKNILGTNDFNENTIWYWASAGKTVMSFSIGLAQQEGFININDKTSDYLGKPWTNLTEEQENLITIKHQLTMTTGLDYDVTDQDCTDADCLNYKINAGEEWYYYNAPYILLRDVISEATNVNYETYIEENLENKIGMSSAEWLGNGTKLYWSNARDMARFGLLILNQGTWNNETLLTDSNYFTDMTTTSQNFNDAYGYLWWLNGKESMIFPSTTNTINIELASNAPDDLIAAIGKNGQFIDVIPSKNMVVIRMGKASSESLVPTVFHNEMWQYINDIID